MVSKLQGKRIAFIATDGVEQVELTRPWQTIQSAGAQTELIAPHRGKIHGMNHLDKGDDFEVNKTIAEAKAEDYDGLVLPGGVASPDHLRMDEGVVRFVKAFFEQRKPVAAICHGPWTLVEAGVLKGRTITSWPSLRTDIRNAGGNWVDEEVHVDGMLVTSRKPDDLEAFCTKAIELFARNTDTERSRPASGERRATL